MQSFEGCIEPFVVAGRSAEPGCAGERALEDPATRQQHETAFSHGMLDHFKAQAVFPGGFGRDRPV